MLRNQINQFKNNKKIKIIKEMNIMVVRINKRINKWNVNRLKNKRQYQIRKLNNISIVIWLYYKNCKSIILIDH